MEKNKTARLPLEDSFYWEKVTAALGKQFTCDLENASKESYASVVVDTIFSYRTDYDAKYSSSNCRVLEAALQRYQPLISTELLLGSIANVCLQSKAQAHTKIHLLESGRDGINELSDREVLTILARAFFCTFKERDTDFKYSKYPSINFIKLYINHSRDFAAEENKIEKLMCLLSYFDQMVNGQRNAASRTIKYIRKVSFKKIQWQTSTHHLVEPGFSSLPIEQSSCDLHVDFANKFVGGGSLGNGCVQEEICFVTCPELIAAQLFTEQLGDNEVLFVKGFECFSEYSGYSKSFKFLQRAQPSGAKTGDHSSPRFIVAMDALNFHNQDKYAQYKQEKVDRELHKCHVAFGHEKLSSIATGNWGCGAFGGDPQLKLFLQWIAASIHSRRIEFHMIDRKDMQELQHLFSEAKKHKISVGKLYQAAMLYSPAGRMGFLEYLANSTSSKPTKSSYSSKSHSKPRATAHHNSIPTATYNGNDKPTNKENCESPKTVKELAQNFEDTKNESTNSRSESTDVKHNQRPRGNDSSQIKAIICPDLHFNGSAQPSSKPSQV